MGRLGLGLCAAVFLAAPAAAQFDSAEQVKPILKTIKPQWISLREFNGQDLLYFTMLEVYRCGIEQIRFVINDGKPQVWETEPCEGDETFSEIGEDRLPYATLPLQSVDKVRIELTYDDGTVEWGEYARGDVLQ
ncbi:hypothetical protein P1J78_13410 [Psychromarinibacter sp. C21-152]|uniref:Uncharacterized protein n=1 Tax=Psychromarinibacter sediminicola TaxID=3033385 RepID=A0AAE3NTF0_9RHOB|nr:hypothetical protein [Psychromarinibacter sediminicola]MDF0601737.1 hypothetical protein [Psychromarinibacter sediminicola]